MIPCFYLFDRKHNGCVIYLGVID